MQIEVLNRHLVMRKLLELPLRLIPIVALYVQSFTANVSTLSAIYRALPLVK